MMRSGVIPQYTLAYSKLFVWNMTQYRALLWMDSDTIAARSIHKLFLRADRCEKTTRILSVQFLTLQIRLLDFKDEKAGPRIGMTHDCDFYRHFLDNGKYPEEGLKGVAYSNSGVMLIKPGVTHHKMPSFFQITK